jgi:hypothetical protein
MLKSCLTNTQTRPNRPDQIHRRGVMPLALPCGQLCANLLSGTYECCYVWRYTASGSRPVTKLGAECQSWKNRHNFYVSYLTLVFVRYCRDTSGISDDPHLQLEILALTGKKVDVHIFAGLFVMYSWNIVTQRLEVARTLAANAYRVCSSWWLTRSRSGLPAVHSVMGTQIRRSQVQQTFRGCPCPMSQKKPTCHNAVNCACRRIWQPLGTTESRLCQRYSDAIVTATICNNSETVSLPQIQLHYNLFCLRICLDIGTVVEIQVVVS